MLYFMPRVIRDMNPIIFIPGLFGSFGNDIIPGAGAFSFGAAEDVYRPMIDNLKAMGYVEGKDLFICFYDWRKKNLYSCEKYLVPLVKKVKEITGAKKINLICHSMGGIVARSYIASRFYQGDIDKLIMIGTPNLGSVNAYFFWSGCQLPYERVENNFLFKILKEGFLWIYKIIYGFKNNIDLIQSIFPSGGELIPSYGYGDYLFYENYEGYKEFVPINQMSIRNEYLNLLNNLQYMPNRYGVRTYAIVGTGIETNRYICVEKNTYNNKLWIDGRPKYPIQNSYGDGTVTSRSGAAIDGLVRYINSNHTDIVDDSKHIVSEILNRRIIVNQDLGKKKLKYCGILTKNIESIEIKINDSINTVTSNTNINSENIKSIRISEDMNWVLIKQKPLTKIKITFRIMPGLEGKILLLNEKEPSVLNKQKEITISGEYSVVI